MLLSIFSSLKRVGLAALLLAGLASTWFYRGGSSHSIELVKSEPQAGAILSTPPQQVKAWFNEEMQTGESTLRVVAEDGTQVDLGDGGVDLSDPEHASILVNLPQNLPDGLYAVRYHVVLLDGDSTDGQFYFFVGDQTTGSAKLAGVQPSASQAETGTGTGGGLLGTSGLLIAVGGIGLLVVAGILLFASRRKNTAV